MAPGHGGGVACITEDDNLSTLVTDSWVRGRVWIRVRIRVVEALAVGALFFWTQNVFGPQYSIGELNGLPFYTKSKNQINRLRFEVVHRQARRVGQVKGWRCSEFRTVLEHAETLFRVRDA